MAAVIGLASATAWGESYNLAGLSYDMDHYSFNKEWGEDASEMNFQLHGVGVHYLHGFGLGKNMFLETGLTFSGSFDSKTRDTDRFSPGEQGTISVTGTRKTNHRRLSFTVPVSYLVRIPLTEKVSLDPFAGIDFRFNCLLQEKESFDEKATLSIPGEPDLVYRASSAGCYVNLLKEDWNVFQIGWHVGVGVDVWKLNIRASYGTFFIPALRREASIALFDYGSYSRDDGKKHYERINQGEFRLAVSWKF